MSAIRDQAARAPAASPGVVRRGVVTALSILAVTAAAVLILMRYGAVRTIDVGEGDRIELVNGSAVVVPAGFSGQLATTWWPSRWLVAGDVPLQTLDAWIETGTALPFVHVEVLTPELEASTLESLSSDVTLSGGTYATPEGVPAQVWVSREESPTPYVHVLLRPDGSDPLHIYAGTSAVNRAVRRGASDEELVRVAVELVKLRIE